MVGSVRDLQSKRELDSMIGSGAPFILNFWAPWCGASKQMDQVFSHLCTDFPHAHFLRVEAEEMAEVSEAYSVSAVPYFVFIKDGKCVDTLEGADPSSLANKVAKVAGLISSVDPAAPASLGMAAGPAILETIKELSQDIGVSYEKGNPNPNPNPKKSTDSDLMSRLETLINSASVMVFMKGNPDEPECGFSRKMVEILQSEKVEFSSFDILGDDSVRQGLKVYSNWSSYPQLYIKGELIGGSDIVLEMHKSGELKNLLIEKGVFTKEPLEERLKKLINLSPTMVFMKGDSDSPRCGFSAKVVDALRNDGVSFGCFDILSDDEVRQGLKAFSRWPTFPQVYYKGELVGGCDIILELHNNGDLKSTLSE